MIYRYECKKCKALYIGKTKQNSCRFCRGDFIELPEPLEDIKIYFRIPFFRYFIVKEKGMKVFSLAKKAFTENGYEWRVL